MSEKNIIWIVLDSIRADHTSIGGYHRDTTPGLTKLANDPVGFSTTCTSHAIWSLPSVASMMTCTYPEQHRVGIDNEALHEDVPTVADRLSSAGWHTIGLSVNPYFSEGTGLNRGFDEFRSYDVLDLAKDAGILKLSKFIRDIRKFSGGLSTDKRKHSPDYLLGSVVKDHFDAATNGSNPFFLCAHFNGAHHPYNPSPHFRKQFTNEFSQSTDEIFEMGYKNTKNIYENIASENAFSDVERDAIVAMYDSLIMQTDELIYDLVQHIKTTETDRETVVVITSDHGDHLGEYGLISHKLTLHDGLLQVPVVVYGDHPFSGSGLTQHCDVIKTLLEDVGVSTKGFAGIDLRNETRKYTISQRGGITYDRTIKKVQENNPEFVLDHTSPGTLTAISDGSWKLLEGETLRRLFELPDEDTDHSNGYLEKKEELESELRRWKEAHDSIITGKAEAVHSNKMKRRLRDLGYITE